MNKISYFLFSMFLLTLSNSHAIALPNCTGTKESWTGCFGTLTIEKLGEYEGEFRLGAFHGQGTFTFFDGRNYTGEWKHSGPHGQGKLTYLNGSIYKGSFKEGVESGLGTIIFVDGSRVDGEWSNGTQNGYAVVYNSNGSIHRELLLKDGDVIKVLNSEDIAAFKVGFFEVQRNFDEMAKNAKSLGLSDKKIKISIKLHKRHLSNQKVTNYFWDRLKYSIIPIAFDDVKKENGQRIAQTIWNTLAAEVFQNGYERLSDNDIKSQIEIRISQLKFLKANFPEFCIKDAEGTLSTSERMMLETEFAKKQSIIDFEMSLHITYKAALAEIHNYPPKREVGSEVLEKYVSWISEESKISKMPLTVQNYLLSQSGAAKLKKPQYACDHQIYNEKLYLNWPDPFGPQLRLITYLEAN